MDAIKAVKPKDGRESSVHTVHCQFNALDGENWMKLRSGASKIAKYVNGQDHVTLDLGQVIFTDTTTMTGDGPWQFRLWELTGNKWVNSDVEMEAGAGVVPYSFKKNNPANAIQWAIGLELALLVKDPWKVYMTTDHPNGGPFYYYPKVISWLMSRKSRTETMLESNKASVRKTTLDGTYREYTFNEIAIVTRAATAKALGLKNKGHIGIGADADVSIYKIDASEWRPSEFEELEKAFNRISYTIKSGEIVVKDGDVHSTPLGSTFWADAKVPIDLNNELEKDLEEEFKKFYTISFRNYPVEDAYLPTQVPIQAQGGV
jgi:formylmethanofuran dehydrogenase subunit A